MIRLLLFLLVTKRIVMGKVKVSELKIEQLIPDDVNANKGTEYGEHLIDKSFRELGAGRSVLLDKNNRLIAGNKSALKCAEIGLDDVIVIETDGTKLVAVKRTDIDLDSERGRTLALADNATSKANLAWDVENIHAISEKWGVDVEDWGVELPELKEPDEEQDEEKNVTTTRLIVECSDIMKLSALFSELQDRGFNCELKE